MFMYDTMHIPWWGNETLNFEHTRGTSMASSTRSDVLVHCDISVVKKRNTTSIVWDYFGLLANPDGSVVWGEANYPMCRSCGKSVPVKGGNTTNLLTHLRDRHPDLYAEASLKVAKKSATAASSANENRQPTLLQSIKRSAGTSVPSERIFSIAGCIADHHRAHLTPVKRGQTSVSSK